MMKTIIQNTNDAQNAHRDKLNVSIPAPVRLPMTSEPSSNTKIAESLFKSQISQIRNACDSKISISIDFGDSLSLILALRNELRYWLASRNLVLRDGSGKAHCRQTARQIVRLIRATQEARQS